MTPNPEPRPFQTPTRLLILIGSALFWFHIDNRIMLAHVEDEHLGYMWN